LGFSGAAAASASVELCRLEVNAIRVVVDGRTAPADRSWRAQRWAAYRIEDIVFVAGGGVFPFQGDAE
jgi:hypothetical protein